MTSDTRALNPHGIHYLKFAVALSVICTHSVVWICDFSGFRFHIKNDFITKVLTIALSALIVPMTAGAVQALSLNPRFVAGKLQDVALKPFLLVFAFLAFLESLKAMLVYAPGVFFAWNVVHMIAVSLVVILLLARKSIHLVWISGLLCLALTPALREWLAPLVISDIGTVTMLNEIGLPKFLLFFMGVVATVLGAIWLSRTDRLERRYKWRVGLLGLIAFNLFAFAVYRAETEFYFAARIVSLPLGAIVGDELGLHYWPLFPWYSTVAFGFMLYYGLSRASRPLLTRLSLLAMSTAGLAYYYRYHFDGILAEMSEATLWSHDVFSGNLWVVFFAVCLFTALALFYERLARSETVATWNEKIPALFRVPFVFSKTIFWAYLFVNSFGIFLAYPFAKLLPPVYALAIYPVFAAVLWYWLGEAVINWLGKKSFSIRLTRATS